MKNIDYSCPNCGGKMVLSEDQKNKKCLYCDSVVPLSEKELKDAKEVISRLGILKHNHLDIIKEISRKYRPQERLNYLTSESLELAQRACQIKEDFKIPEQEEVFFMYDATFLSTFKYGFVICTSGLYYRMGRFKKSGMYNWEQFKNLQIHAVGGSLYVGRMLFHVKEYRTLGNMLLKIQEKI